MVTNLSQGDGFANFLFEKRKRTRPKLIARASEVEELNDPERGQKEWYPSAKLDAKTIGFHIHELAPGQRSGTHRHTCEALLYIIEGQGATTIDGERVSWRAGDTLYVPPMVWHFHENDGQGPARVLGMWNIPLLEMMGLFYNEELGDTGHPDARPSVRDTALPQRA